MKLIRATLEQILDILSTEPPNYAGVARRVGIAQSSFWNWHARSRKDEAARIESSIFLLVWPENAGQPEWFHHLIYRAMSLYVPRDGVSRRPDVARRAEVSSPRDWSRYRREENDAKKVGIFEGIVALGDPSANPAILKMPISERTRSINAWWRLATLNNPELKKLLLPSMEELQKVLNTLHPLTDRRIAKAYDVTPQPEIRLVHPKKATCSAPRRRSC